MKPLGKLHVWWPLMDTYIKQSVKSCKSCQLNQTMPAKTWEHSLETTKAPWIRIHLDFAGHFLDKMFFILYGLYSRWIEVYHMSNIISKAKINSLRHSFATHRLPYIIVTDNGISFTSKEFKIFCTVNGIKDYLHYKMITFKMCHLRHKLRIFLFHKKVVFHFQDIQDIHFQFSNLFQLLNNQICQDSSFIFLKR